LKDKGRPDYTLNPTTRGPANGVQFKVPVLLSPKDLGASSAGGDERSNGLDLGAAWRLLLSGPKANYGDARLDQGAHSRRDGRSCRPLRRFGNIVGCGDLFIY
jgi:hypothetical protein